MFDAELAGTSLVLAVAQRPFEAESEHGVRYTFALLKPMLHEDGRPALDEDFPANGYVWWMLRPGVRGFAEPGRLLTGTLEESRYVEDREKAWYQVRLDSIEPVNATDWIEVLSAPPGWAAEPRELVNRDRALYLDHPPLDQVYVHWQGHLYGPLRTTAEAASDGQWRIGFSTVNADHSVAKVAASVLPHLPAGAQAELEVGVSLTDAAPDRVGATHQCRYRLVAAPAFQRAAAGAARLLLEDDATLIKRAARQILTRTKRQQLNALLDEVLAGLAGSGAANAATASRVVDTLRQDLAQVQAAADDLSRALLESGVLAGKLEEAAQRAAREHVEKNAARLQTQIDEQLQQARQELDALDKQKEGKQRELEAQFKQEQADQEAALGRQQQEFARACAEREGQIDEQRHELTRQSEVLRGNLAEVARQLRDRGQDVVNQFLAITPLLQQLQIFPATPPPPAPATPAEAVSAARPWVRQFDLPAFVRDGSRSSPVAEGAFFARFCEHVEQSGFKFRRLDLAAFHLSVKCNDLTVLGGYPGTGKSSLPRLYAEALAGDEYDEGLRRFLHVGVSPSWLDMHDLLGQANALDGWFQPAESGLYPLLIWSQEEEQRRGLDSRLYLVCLDEMNLAQVEHYFSGFLQALQRPIGQREVRCFAPEVVKPSDPFVHWPVLKLPRSLRFVGTVNFDETTRQLSQRVLDRADLIRLRPPHLLDAREPSLRRASGPPVTFGQFRDWVVPSAPLDRTLAELLDQLREPLARLGCPLNPRRYSAVRTFVGNAPAEICAPTQALDLQIAQRLLPQVRNLFRPGARAGLEAIQKVLEPRAAEFTESLQLLGEIEAQELAGDPFAAGELD